MTNFRSLITNIIQNHEKKQRDSSHNEENGNRLAKTARTYEEDEFPLGTRRKRSTELKPASHHGPATVNIKVNSVKILSGSGELIEERYVDKQHSHAHFIKSEEGSRLTTPRDAHLNGATIAQNQKQGNYGGSKKDLFDNHEEPGHNHIQNGEYYTKHPNRSDKVTQYNKHKEEPAHLQPDQWYYNEIKEFSAMNTSPRPHKYMSSRLREDFKDKPKPERKLETEAPKNAKK